MKSKLTNNIDVRASQSHYLLPVCIGGLALASLVVFLLHQRGGQPAKNTKTIPDSNHTQPSTMRNERTIESARLRESRALEEKRMESIAAQTNRRRNSETKVRSNTDIGFRLCAITSSRSGTPSVGIVNRDNGTINLLKIGDKTINGWLLIDADVENGTARFQKEDIMRTIHLEKDPSLETKVIASQAPSQVADSQQQFLEGDPDRDAPRIRQPETIFSNRVYHVEGGDDFAINSIKDNTEFVEIKTGDETYSMRREIVDRILAADNLTTEQRLFMMISYPGLASVPPGQDAATQAAQAELELSGMLTPPPDPPPMEEIERLRENFTPHPPSETSTIQK